ncbi:polyketide cyclase [Prevotella sp. oral taxon 376]|uniref:polyketide cyclase n=1 Tax=Prevotella sp. oral taxon 376 TaxID=712466 RepID=UPI000D1FAD43|nr:polyketide cyclase [Prevotella sp. oral taxon 376]PTL33866.1 polyketide cyclase [Prevotella sp. oral taxon 376]
MSSTFESTIRQIPYPQTSVYEKLSDLNNLEKVRDRIPQDKLEDFSFDADHIAIKAPVVGEIKLRIIDREEPKTIKFETEQSPVPFDFWIQLLPMDAGNCKMKLTIKAELNPFIKGMVSGPLTEGLEKVADVLQMIQYE